MSGVGTRSAPPADRGDRPHGEVGDSRRGDGDGGFDVAGWVAASCRAQGVPVKVTDARVVARVAVLFGAIAPAGSESPDGLDPAGVEGAAPGAAGDDGVIEHSGDDRVLAVEAEGVPLGS